MIKPVAGEAKVNKAEAHEPKSGHKPPAASNKSASSDTGSMNKANLSGAFSGAVGELKAQHPVAYYDHGPHHGTQHHVRHKPYKMK